MCWLHHGVQHARCAVGRGLQSGSVLVSGKRGLGTSGKRILVHQNQTKSLSMCSRVQTTRNFWRGRRWLSSEASDDAKERDQAIVSAMNPDELLDQVMVRPSQEAFHKAITTFANRPGKFKRGSVDFVYTTLQMLGLLMKDSKHDANPQKMDEANVPVTLETYNRLFDIFPEKRFATKSLFDVIWPNYTEQVDCALVLLQRMEDDGMCPDVVTYDRVKAVFGSSSPPLRKLETMAYWFLKFGIKPTYQYHKRNTPHIASVYERTIAALKGIAGESADVRFHHQNTDSDDASVSELGDEPSFYVLSTTTPLQDVRLMQLKKTGLGERERRLQVDGPILHYFDFTMLPYYELIAHGDGQAHSVGICMLSHQSAENLGLWVNDVVSDNDTFTGVDVVYSLRETAQK